jgi:hypothetical protein
MAIDRIQESQSWPVNELGEIVAEVGIGSTTVVGFIPSSFIPTNITTKKIVINGLGSISNTGIPASVRYGMIAAQVISSTEWAVA